MSKIRKLTIFESLWSLWNLVRENLGSVIAALIAAGGAVKGFWKYIQLAADLEGWWVYPVAITLIIGACISLVAVVVLCARALRDSLSGDNGKTEREQPASQAPTSSGTTVEVGDAGISPPLSPTPLNENSVFVYIRGARVRRLDKAIADELGRPIEGPPIEYSITKEAEAFGIADVAVLDRLLAENEADVLAMAPYVAPSTPMHPGHSISVLFRVLTARLGSIEAIAEHYRSLDHQGDLAGFAEHLLESYKQMSPQHVRLFQRALHVSKILFQMPKLRKESVVHLTFTVFNGTGDDIRLKAIDGYIKAATGDDANPTAAGRLSRPRFHKLTDTHVEAFREFHFSIEQEIPTRLAELMGSWEDGKSFVLDFEDLNIIVQSTADAHKMARLPLWDSVVLTRRGTEIKTSQRAYLRVGHAFPFKSLSQG